MVEPMIDAPVYRPNRVRLMRAFLKLVTGVLFDVRVEGREHLAKGPVIYCANHLNWTDPLVLLAVMPARPEAGDVRAQGGRHVRGRPEPAHHVGRVRDPVPARQDGPAR